MKRLILLLSISFMFGFDGGAPNPNTPLVVAASGLVVAVSTDVWNCMYPYYNGEHENIGMFFCSWEEEDFYYRNGRYILHKTYSADNWIEKRMRKRYWRRRNK